MGPEEQHSNVLTNAGRRGRLQGQIVELGHGFPFIAAFIVHMIRIEGMALMMNGNSEYMDLSKHALSTGTRNDLE